MWLPWELRKLQALPGRFELSLGFRALWLKNSCTAPALKPLRARSPPGAFVVGKPVLCWEFLHSGGPVGRCVCVLGATDLTSSFHRGNLICAATTNQRFWVCAAQSASLATVHLKATQLCGTYCKGVSSTSSLGFSGPKEAVNSWLAHRGETSPGPFCL